MSGTANYGACPYILTGNWLPDILAIMSRLARVVIPGYPHHITHRGNRREEVFITPDDRDVYRASLRKHAKEHGLQIWAYCLMSNHIHLIALPECEDSLARAIGRSHMRYSRWINHQQEWSGHLWANRFYSTLLDEEHLWAAVKYVELNPVRAGIVTHAEDYPWSSAQAHALGRFDPLLSPNRPFINQTRIRDWRSWLAEGLDEEIVKRIRNNTTTGWPTGSPSFVAQLEKLLGRRLTRQKPGPKPKAKEI